MLRIIFTLDYEIHGNGDGNPLSLMVEPTERLLRLFDEYGAKLTIMADVAEILKFGEYRNSCNRDDYHFETIKDQLRKTIESGHDVQLHIHSSYFNARHQNGKWLQDWTEYDFANLPFNRMQWMIKTCKEFLETTLLPMDPKYKCLAFRAANWSVSPSRNVIQALIDNDIRIDTSVFKYGSREGVVNFDYSHAEHEYLPWLADQDDICQSNRDGKIWEYPIYSEKRWVGAFFSPNRVYRAVLGKFHPVSDVYHGAKKNTSRRKNSSPLGRFFRKHAWKADFNQCSGRQLINALLRAEKQTPATEIAPFVLIGHPKLFNSWNEKTLRTFLAFAAGQRERFGFGTLASVAKQANCCGLNP